MADEKRNPDVKTIYDALQAKTPKYLSLQNYYAGNQPTVYLTQRLREIFRNLDLVFTENWCAVVVDSEKERINLMGFEAKNQTVQQTLMDAFNRNDLKNESDDISTDALVTSECYAIAWPGEDGKAEVFYNDPTMVHCVYSGENPRKMRYAGKKFEEDKKAHLTLYYPDHLEYYVANQKLKDVSSAELA